METPDIGTETEGSPRRSALAALLRRGWPLVVLGAGIGAFFVFNGDRYLMLETLSDNREELMRFVQENMIGSVLLYMAIYAATTALAVPGASVLTIAGGFLFGIAFGTIWVVVAATVGAAILFLGARTVFSDSLRRRAGSVVQKMEAGFGENAFSYLLSLRLLPVFPFFLVNIVPALLGVPLRSYFLATLIGIIPGTFVFASIGAGLGSVFDMMMTFSLADAVTPEIIVALVSLSVLALVPPVHKRLRARRRGGAADRTPR